VERRGKSSPGGQATGLLRKPYPEQHREENEKKLARLFSEVAVSLRVISGQDR